MAKSSHLIRSCFVAAVACATTHASYGQNCNETRFPTLGPGARSTQTGVDIPNPLNIGTLDVRAMGAGGYSEGTFRGNRYGIYRLRGGPQRYGNTLTRVERSFRTVSIARNRNIELQALFVVPDASDRGTVFTQVHVSGHNIVSGLGAGNRAESAQVSIAFEKTSDPNRLNLVLSETVEPFLAGVRGRRVSTSLRTIAVGVEYQLLFRTGYDGQMRSFTSVTVRRASNPSDTETLRRVHRFTTDAKSLRYGAYEAADRGDTGAEIRFRNVRLCRNG